MVLSKEVACVVWRNARNGMSSCLTKPCCGSVPWLTSSTTATSEAAVVQAMAVRAVPHLDRVIVHHQGLCVCKVPCLFPCAEACTSTQSASSGGSATCIRCTSSPCVLKAQLLEQQLHASEMAGIANAFVVEGFDGALVGLRHGAQPPEVVNAS